MTTSLFRIESNINFVDYQKVDIVIMRLHHNPIRNYIGLWC